MRRWLFLEGISSRPLVNPVPLPARLPEAEAPPDLSPREPIRASAKRKPGRKKTAPTTVKRTRRKVQPVLVEA